MSAHNMSAHIIAISCITGFIGDALLQVAVNIGLGGSTGFGLKPYFIQHGSAESTFIAGGMMALFYIIYMYLVGTFTFTSLAIYGILLDFIFRKMGLFSSLKEYYKYLNYFWSAVWGAIPMMLPLFIYNIINLY